MDEEMANGGRQALLADFLSVDLDAPNAPNLRIIPKTAALLEQKLRSLDACANWWFEPLSDGTTTRRGSSWQTRVSIDTLFDDYVHKAEKIGVRRKSEKTAFGMKLRKLVLGVFARAADDPRRAWGRFDRHAAAMVFRISGFEGLPGGVRGRRGAVCRLGSRGR
jgi:hypothetical protein